jgi:hypothetical protein
MGWEDYHVHEFRFKRTTYGLPQSMTGSVKDEKAFRLKRLISGEGETFGYLYDLGDEWKHTVLVEKKLPDNAEMQCLDGSRACPPEDCGGVEGYQCLLKVLDGGEGILHDRIVEQYEGYDPEAFDPDTVNRALKLLTKGKGGADSSAEALWLAIR